MAGKARSSEEKLNYYTEVFERQMKYDDMHRLPGEHLVQCLDDTSFGGKFYKPEWAVSDQGRVWSIQYGMWLAPFTDKTKGRYWKYKIDRPVIGRELIANYWCDKREVNTYGEDHTFVRYHQQPEDIPSSLRHGTFANKDGRIADAMRRDNAANLYYVHINRNDR